MLMHTREWTTIGTQQEKVTNETRPSRSSKALLCSILPVVEKGSLVICDVQYSSYRISQVERSLLLLDTFSKSSTLPWQHTASSSFSWSFSPATIDFHKSPSFDFYMARNLSRLGRWLGRFAAQKSRRLVASLPLDGFATFLQSMAW